FEHAMCVMDSDADGWDELYLASDDQRRVQRVLWDQQAGRWRREKIHASQAGFSLTWFVAPLPAGR
ncbi:MAG: hypothetical protein AAFZ65_05145, partial [Planctomycetota bacterium]